MFLIVMVRSTAGADRRIVVVDAPGTICISASAQLPSPGRVTLVLDPVWPPVAPAVEPLPGCCDCTWAGSGSEGPLPAGGLSTKDGVSSGVDLPGAEVGRDDEDEAAL